MSPVANGPETLPGKGERRSVKLDAAGMQMWANVVSHGIRNRALLSIARVWY